MATNAPIGDGHRQGAVRKRTQVKSPLSKTWTKRDRTTGEFMDQKEDPDPFKGVVKEPTKRDSKKRSGTRSKGRASTRAATGRKKASRSAVKKKATRGGAGGRKTGRTRATRAKAGTRKGR